MNNFRKPDPALAHLRAVFAALAALWLAVVAGSFGWQFRVAQDNLFELARTEARSRYQKDLLYRTWATGHGGVYVRANQPETNSLPMGNTRQPVVTTAAGQPLRFIEPDTILREVHELGEGLENVQSHVTSLKPSRLENFADAWETNALRAFAAGSNEVASVEQIGGQSVMRLMHPMRTVAECLQCHEESDHQIGEVRGGISVMVPLANYQGLARTDMAQHGLWHGLFALVGLAGLWLSHRYVSHSLRARNQALAAQAETEERFRLLFDNVSTIAAQGYGLDGTVRFWNQASEQLYGYTAAEACGRNLLELIIPPEMKAGVQAAVRQMAETGRAIPAGEISLMRKDGSRVSVYSSHTIVDTKDRGRELYCLDIDLTERKRAEENLSKSEHRFRTVVETANDAVFISVDRKFTYLNAAALRLFGARQPAELVGLSVMDRIHPDYRAVVLQRSAQTETRQRAVPVLEEIYLRLDGAPVSVEVSAAPISHEGQPGAIVFVRDITERKQAEAALRQNEAELRTLIENIPQKIFLKDRNSRYVFINEKFAQDLGLRPADVVGKQDSDLFPKELADKYRADDQRIMETGQTEEMEESFKRQNGVAWIHTVKAPVRDQHGATIGVCGIFRDISEQRHLEQQFRQAQKMESFGQLAGGVAHDFNNILAIIQMQASLLAMESGVSQGELECAREISMACQKAANLTQQLLLFSRKKPLEARDLDLNEVLGNITKMLQRILGEDVAMQLKLTPGTLGVHADAGMIDQILLNLVVNARDAMARGGTVLVETAGVEFDELAAKQCPGARPGAFACLSVRDTGSGIPAEILPRIFEPFFTTKEVGKGTGLGLATVYGIVQQHHGWISVESQLGQGTTFLIYLPRLLKAREGPGLPAAAPPLRRGRETILLVEDDPGLRASIRRLLSQLGYRVLEAPDGISAGTVWKEHRAGIQLLLTDMVMPGGMTGKELGQRLRQEVPQLKVICMSGYSSETIGQNGRLADGLFFLAKPFQAHQLAQMVRDCLDSV